MSSEQRTLTPVTVTYQVTGMTCGHCEAAVTSEVSGVDGVSEVRATAATGRVTVTADGPLDDTAIAAAVDEAGYELTGRAA